MFWTLQIGFVNTPGPPCGYAKPIPALDELRCKALYPTHNRGVPRDFLRGVRQRQSALGHHLDQIAQAELVAKVPAHAENNDLPIKMPTIEQPLQTLPLAYHRPSDWLHSHFNRSNEPICTRTQKPLEPIPLNTGSHIRKGRLNFGGRLRCLPHAVLLAYFLSNPTHFTIARLADLTATEPSMLGKTTNLRWKIVAFLTLPLPSPANLIADPCAYHPGKPSRAVAAVRSRRSSIK